MINNIIWKSIIEISFKYKFKWDRSLILYFTHVHWMKAVESVKPVEFQLNLKSTSLITINE